MPRNTLAALIRRLLHRPPPARMTAGEAQAIGHAALAEAGLLSPWTERELATWRSSDGHWHVATAVRGAGAGAIIDDATGTVREARRWGGR